MHTHNRIYHWAASNYGKHSVFRRYSTPNSINGQTRSERFRILQSYLTYIKRNKMKQIERSEEEEEEEEEINNDES